MTIQSEVAAQWLRLRREHDELTARHEEVKGKLSRSAGELSNVAVQLLSFVGQEGTGTNSKSRKVFRVGEVFVLVDSEQGVVIVDEERG